MKLTGKCKEDFEVYIHSHYHHDDIEDSEDWWDSFPMSMKWGVLQDFADSVGIEIKVGHGINLITDEPDGFDYSITTYTDLGFGGYCGFESTRPEARTAAIEKFNELYNKNHENKSRN